MNSLKTIIDELKTITLSHEQVEMCYTGQISDISTPKDGLPPAYPYVFYIIEGVTGGSRQSVAKITGIFQTMCIDEEDAILQAQSDMALIAKDIWSYYKLTLSVKTEMTEYTLVPFVERFEDMVAGVTMSVDLVYEDPATICNFPLKTT